MAVVVVCGVYVEQHDGWMDAVAKVDQENVFRHLCYDRSRKMKTVCIKLNFQYLEWTLKVLVSQSAY